MENTEKLTLNLLLFLHTITDTRKSVEEIYQSWVCQLDEIPPIQMIPMLFQEIENFCNASPSTELLNICYKETFLVS